MSIDEYKEVNESFKKVLIFKIGINSGFFSEYNNMILAMLYCLENRIQFKLSSMVRILTLSLAGMAILIVFVIL